MSVGFALSVKEDASVQRTSSPVTAGLPFGRGELKDVDCVRLAGPQREIPAQFSAASRCDDGSIRWAHAWFQIDLDAGAGVELTARIADGPAPAQRPAARDVEGGRVACLESGHRQRARGRRPVRDGVEYTFLSVAGDPVAELRDVRLDVRGMGPIAQTTTAGSHGPLQFSLQGSALAMRQECVYEHDPGGQGPEPRGLAALDFACRLQVGKETHKGKKHPGWLTFGTANGS